MSTKVFSVESVTLSLLKSNPPQLQITAMGMVNSTGWENPQLKPLRSTPEGLYEFEFVADRPTGVVADVMQPISASFRYREIPPLKGVRVYAETNFIDEPFGKQEEVPGEHKFLGYLFAKLGRIGSKSEGPDYFLQLLSEGSVGKELPILKKTHLWEEDPKLHVFLGQRVVVYGEYDGNMLVYKEVNPLVNA